MQYVGFWWRVLAYIIDSIILLVGFVIVGLFLPGMMAVAPTDSMDAAAATGGLIGTLISILLPAVYMVAFNSSKMMATPGKFILGFAVVSQAGKRLSVPNAIGRYFAMWISSLILCIGFIMVAFTEKKQGLHDMIAKTLVVKRASLAHTA